MVNHKPLEHITHTRSKTLIFTLYGISEIPCFGYEY